MSNPVLRQQSFTWPEPGLGLAALEFVHPGGVVAGTALSSGAAATSALLVLPPSWDSTELTQIFSLNDASFPDLQTLLGLDASSAVNLETTALVADRSEDTGVLALLASGPLGTESAATLLVSLAELSGVPKRRLTTLVPDQQVNQLLRPQPSQSDLDLISVGTVLPPELIGNGSGLPLDRGSVTTVYELLEQPSGSSSRQQRYSVFPATADDITSQGLDAVLVPTQSGLEPVLVQVGTVSEPTSTGLQLSGSGDILISAIDSADGSILWEELFGNSSVEQTPRIALADDNALYVGATLQGSFGDSNSAAVSSDVGIGLAKYTSDGELLWRRRLADGFGTADGGDSQLISDLTVAADGSLLVLGLTTTAYGGLHGEDAQGEGTDFDSFIAAYSPEGNRLWTHQFGSPEHDRARAFAFMPVAEGDASVESLVVVGDRAPLSAPDLSQAWMQLLEVSPLDSIASEWLAPAPPTITWAVVDGVLSEAPLLRASGMADPGALITLQSPLFNGEQVVQADVITGEWLIQQALQPLPDASQPSFLLTAEAKSSSGLVSDAVIGQAILGGSGLPGEAPQILWIDPDGTGPQIEAPLLRSITRLGSGPDTSVAQRLLVDYSGTLTDGTPFDSSLNEGRRPFELTLGAGRVITGWDLGLQGLPLGSEVELLIPPSLAYGERDTASIPANSTLLFDVDLRVDLRLPEVFLRDVVWPDLFNADYAQLNAELLSSYQADLLQLAARLGPEDGTPADDSIAVVAPVDYPQYPLLALGADGADQLSSDDHAAILFGEWGDDELSLTSPSIPYGFLDGGEGDDRLESSAVISWLRGGPGFDRAVVNPGDWRLLQTSSFDANPYYLVGRYADASASAAQQLLYLQDIEDVDGIEAISYDISGGTIEDLLDFLEVLPIPLQLSDTSLTADVLLDLLAQTEGSIDMAEVDSIAGTIADIQVLIGSERIFGLEDKVFQLTDLSIAAADLSDVLLLTGTTIDFAAVDSVEGTLNDLQELLGNQRISGVEGQSLKLSDTSLSAGALVDLLDQTDGSIDLERLASLEGNLSPIQGLFANNRLNGLSPETVRLSDGVLGASDLLQFEAESGSTLVAQSLVDLAGTEQDRNAVFNTASILINLQDDVAPSLVRVSAPVGVYGPDSVIPLTLQFDEPVQFESSSSAAPSLLLSQYITAEYVPEPDTTAFASSHRFDALIGEVETSDDLQLLDITGVSGVVDQFGNRSLKPFDAATGVDGPQLSSQEWNLDVDGDGSISALSDGFMIVRKLFGNFIGDALTNKAVSPAARRSTEAIHSYIERGIDAGFLDVDRNGTTNALGDGLMIVRELFGFSGVGLIDKAIAPNSDFLGGRSFSELSQSDLFSVSSQVSGSIQSLTGLA